MSANVAIACVALRPIHGQIGEWIARGIGHDPIQRIDLRQEYAPIADLLRVVRGPDLAVLHGFLLARADRARLALDAVIGFLPLMDPVSHGIGLLQAFRAEPE